MAFVVPKSTARMPLALKKGREETVASGLELLKSMTLTVVDGDFPREVLAKENLKFADYRMPRNRNQHAEL